MEKKALIILNPRSGNEKAKRDVGELIEKLYNHFDKVDIRYTRKKHDAMNFSKMSEKDGYDSVFGMGGDGTINEIVNGLATLKNPPKFAVLPFGTVNDIARALNIPMNTNRAIDNFSIDKIKKIDIGIVNGKYFSNVVAIGIVPEAVGAVTPEEKAKFGKIAYYLSGFKKLSENISYEFEMELDGVKNKIQTTTILIAITNSVGGFENLIPNSKVDDGYLHMIYSKDKNPVETIMSIPDLLMGVTKSTDQIGYAKFKKGKIKASSDKILTTNIDGDEGVNLPLEIEIIEKRLQVYYQDDK